MRESLENMAANYLFGRVEIKENAEQKHSPDGEKRGGAGATSSLALLVMQVVGLITK